MHEGSAGLMISRGRMALLALVISEVLSVTLLPYCLSLGRVSVPFQLMRAEYSYTVEVSSYLFQQGSFVLSTEDIVNASYIEVTETIMTALGTVANSMTFYVHLGNRSALFSEEFMPELPPHGEYFDLWIGEGHTSGDSVKILNQTATLSGSGLRFYGWTFFNTLMASDLEFNCSMNINYQGRIIPADYQGKLLIVYDQETGLMMEDVQNWIVHYVDLGTPTTFSYTAVLSYRGSNVRFAYFTYALTVGVYSALAILILAIVYVIIRMWQKRRRMQQLPFEQPTGEEPVPPAPPPPTIP